MLVRFAAMTVEILPRYRYTAYLCARYEAPAGAVPDFTVRVGDEEIAAEADPAVEHPAAYLESLAIYRKICHEALRFDTFLFHGSALAMDGVAYLFSAPSGTGKSTHAALWRQMWGERVTMVNDDKPLLTVREGGVFVSGTPWDGKHRLSTPVTVPLRAVCFLARGAENGIQPLTRAEAYPAMFAQTYRPTEEEDMKKTLALLDAAADRVRFFRLHCNMTPEAAEVAYSAMK